MRFFWDIRSQVIVASPHAGSIELIVFSAIDVHDERGIQVDKAVIECFMEIRAQVDAVRYIIRGA